MINLDVKKFRKNKTILYPVRYKLHKHNVEELINDYEKFMNSV